MPLPTRENPETGILEVLVNGDWVEFYSYRKKQIDDAYQNSIRFLRERLGEDSAEQIAQNSADDSSPTEAS